jgi:hypothetical protein
MAGLNVWQAFDIWHRLANRPGLPNGVDQDAHVELVDPLTRVLQLLLADLREPTWRPLRRRTANERYACT